MRIVTLVYLFAFMPLCIPVITEAAVVDSSAYGFTINFDKHVAVHPDSLFQYLVRDIGQWWNPDHTWSGRASNLSIQPFANGCFCESLENGGSVRHMTVVYIDPGKVLRLQGGLGPLQMLAVTGSMTFLISRGKEDTKIVVSYTVGGYIPGGAGQWATPFDKVLGEQVGRLMDYALARK